MLNELALCFSCSRRTWDVDEYQKRADEKAAQRDQEVIFLLVCMADVDSCSRVLNHECE